MDILISVLCLFEKPMLDVVLAEKTSVKVNLVVSV